ncbi:MAG: deoxynucleoside kinase [Promethearchaeota archaeon]
MALTEKYHVKIKKKPLKRKKPKTKKKTRLSKMDGYTFAISGVHGIGKTTIYNIFQKKFKDFPNFRLFPERLRANPPVPFGSKDKQIAFRSEIHYNQQMIERNRLVKKYISKHRENIAILDRSPLSTLIYARALELPKIDYDLIADTFNSVTWQDEHIIYLEADPRTTMKRIYHRGSLDSTRDKWNEDDFIYLKKVINKYEKIFAEFHLFKKKRLHRIWTENKTPQEIVMEIIDIIESISGLQITKKRSFPANQSKLI